jgi:beta-lactam-binding protein with PASTA domain
VTPVPGVTKIALSGSTVLVRASMVTMPNVVGALRASAVAQLQAMGLSVQVSTVPDPDRHRDHVGNVESQTPPPGTVVAPGGHATIRVYGPAQGGCF